MANEKSKENYPRIQFIPADEIDLRDVEEETVPEESSATVLEELEDEYDEFGEDYFSGYMDGKDETEDFLSTIKNDSILQKREDTRGKLALIYTIATFSFFLIIVIVCIIDGLNRNVSIIENLKEIIPIVSSVLLGTLGFVLGYYFKKGEDQ